MRTSELVKILQNRIKKHGDIEVIGTWEGTDHEIDTDNIYMTKNGNLAIDVDGNSYKNSCAVDPN